MHGYVSTIIIVIMRGNGLVSMMESGDRHTYSGSAESAGRLEWPGRRNNLTGKRFKDFGGATGGVVGMQCRPLARARAHTMSVSQDIKAESSKATFFC